MIPSKTAAASVGGSFVILSLLALGFAVEEPVTRFLGPDTEFGDGSVKTYADVDASGAPSAIGVLFTRDGLESPPESMSDLKHCFDRDSSGTVDQPAECMMSHEFVIPLPDEIEDNDDVPFKWVLLNWNPMGHIPPGIYDKPHFDIHFMIASAEDIFAIEDGPCGPEFVRCDQFEIAQRPVASNYMHPDFQDVGAIVPAMGNHLVDLTGPEFAETPFTRSWIYGIYDGEVTFYEEMATLDYILSNPDTCFPIKSPPAVALSGYYPTESCIRYDEAAEAYAVSVESFAFREAEPPSSE